MTYLIIDFDNNDSGVSPCCDRTINHNDVYIYAGPGWYEKWLIYWLTN